METATTGSTTRSTVRTRSSSTGGGPPARLTERLDGILDCVHCGLCLPVCPTYRVLGDENDSPRGRVYLMRAAVEGRTELTAASVRTHIDRCLGCRACETACPAGVEFGSLLEAARADLAAAGHGSVNRRYLDALTRGPVHRILYATLRLARALGVGALAPRLGGLPGRAAYTLAATGRARGVGAGHARGRPSATGSTFSLLEGCVMRGLFGHVHAATRNALAACGWREIRVSRQVCCGALHAHAGELDAARALARHNILAFERSGADYVIVDSAGCAAAMHEYPAWLHDDAGLRGRAEQLARRVRDPTEPLAEHLPPRGFSRPLRVAYDAPCHLLHAKGVDTAPLAALRRIGNLEVVPLPSSANCCGGAGIYNLLQPELSEAVLQGKIAEVRAGGYDAVATGNPGCILQIGAGLLQAGVDVPVVHPVELVALARP